MLLEEQKKQQVENGTGLADLITSSIKAQFDIATEHSADIVDPVLRDQAIKGIRERLHIAGNDKLDWLKHNLVDNEAGIAVSVEGKILLTNMKGCELWDLEPMDVVGRHATDLVKAESSQYKKYMESAALAPGLERPYIFEYEALSGKRHQVLAYGMNFLMDESPVRLSIWKEA